MTVILEGLTKRYGATLALDSVDLTIGSGQVHALLGQNGAGKSTLIKCLGGGTTPTAGTICIGGKQFTGLTPRMAAAEGVAVIYQHLSVIDGLSVAENVFLGSELTQGRVLVDRREQRRLARETLALVGSSADPDEKVGNLSTGQRQLVEIAKALRRDAHLLVLDEPTAALSAAEAGRLTELVLDLKQRGIAILYVTHLLSEVKRLADQATVLRNGAAVWKSAMAGVATADLVAAISGNDDDRPERSTPVPPTPPRPCSCSRWRQRAWGRWTSPSDGGRSLPSTASSVPAVADCCTTCIAVTGRPVGC